MQPGSFCLFQPAPSCSLGFLGDKVVRDPPANAGDTGDTGLIPESGTLPLVGKGKPLQYSSLENPMDRGDWWATVHGISKNWTWLSIHAFCSPVERNSGVFWICISEAIVLSYTQIKLFLNSITDHFIDYLHQHDPPPDSCQPSPFQLKL